MAVGQDLLRVQVAAPRRQGVGIVIVDIKAMGDKNSVSNCYRRS